MKKSRVSLKWGLLTSILLCWIAAMVTVLSIAGILIDYNFERNLEHTLKSDAEGILKQIEMRMTDCIESSKEVSYDGVVRSAYRSYLKDGDHIALYKTATQYLYDSFSRDIMFKAVFINFWNDDVTSNVYVINQKTYSYQILQQCLTRAWPLVTETMKNAGTDIRFILCDGELYMCRNLLDSGFTPYATVTMLCDAEVLLQPLLTLAPMSEAVVQIDGLQLVLGEGGRISEVEAVSENAMIYSTEMDGHSFSFSITRSEFHIWRDMPGLRLAVLGTAAIVLPILAVMIYIFYVTVSKPVETLAAASQRVQGGERGYTINETPNNREFQELYGQFNRMSLELQSQFERSQLEQQALQQAKIRALQSQINPHFLNNTLEVINWEARMEGNDNVSEMIDALSTMLEAALGRDGTGTTTLRREIDYVNAYLYIIGKRLGERFVVTRDIDETLLDMQVPKLILQPIAENAVEHDITPRKGGALHMSIRAEDERLVLEVTHEGVLSEEDKRNIEAMLSGYAPPENKNHVGLCNVAERLYLLYGDRSELSIVQNEGGTISARISLPIGDDVQTSKGKFEQSDTTNNKPSY